MVRTPPPTRSSAARLHKKRMNRPGRARRSRWALSVAVALGGGSLLGTCQTRIRDAVIGGSKDLLFSTLLNPTAFLELISAGGDPAD